MISLVKGGITRLTLVDEAGDGSGQVKVPLVDAAGNPDEGPVPVAEAESVHVVLLNSGLAR